MFQAHLFSAPAVVGDALRDGRVGYEDYRQSRFDFARCRVASGSEQATILYVAVPVAVAVVNPLDSACVAVSEGWSIRQASATFGVPVTTLRRKLGRVGGESEKSPE